VGVAAFIESGSLGTALFALTATMILVLGMGMGFNTWLQGRACRMNPVAVFVSVLLFGWLWGGWGLLLGAPLAAVFKTIADRIEGLQPFGELMGEVPRVETPAAQAQEEQRPA
jgi:predicted PurR-regulated permease PerM